MRDITPHSIRSVYRHRTNIHIPAPVKWIAAGGAIFIGWKLFTGLLLPTVVVGGVGYAGWRLYKYAQNRDDIGG